MCMRSLLLAGLPSQRHGMWKRTTALGRICDWIKASAQLLPPSAETSTLRTMPRPRPDQARPEIL